MIASAAALLAFGMAVVFIRHQRAVHLESLQGAWEGAMHFHVGALQRTQRIVLRILKDNGSYHAIVDQIDTGVRNLPATRFDVGRRRLTFELGSGISYQGELNSARTEITGRWKWPGGNYSQPLTLTRTVTPDVIPEPLVESDYAPRPDSDLQGFWKGTLKFREISLRLHLKIAESSNGTFRAELESIDQPPIVPLTATAVSYQNARVKIRFRGLGAAFDGELVSGGSQIIGKWTQVGTDPLTLVRANPQDEKQALEAGKDYHHTNETELQGHWTGILSRSHGLQLHLVFHIARLLDGSFSATLDSPDQRLFAMPFDVVDFALPRVHLEMKSANCTFEGKLSAGKVSGSWTYNARKAGTLTLERTPSG